MSLPSTPQSPAIHFDFWTKSSSNSPVFSQNQNSLIRSHKNEVKLNPADYFYSICPLLSTLDADEKTHLRPKVSSPLKTTPAEKTDIEEKRKNKEAIKEEDCKNNREKYIKYKLDKMILSDDIAVSLPDHRAQYLKNKIEGIVALQRINAYLGNELSKDANNIDGLTLVLILEMMKGLAKNYIDNDEEKLKSVIWLLIESDPVKFKSCINLIYSKCSQKCNGHTKLKEKGDVKKLVTRLAKKEVDLKFVKEEISSKYSHIFKDFMESESVLNQLGGTVFSMLSETEKTEKLVNVRSSISTERIALQDRLNASIEAYLHNFNGIPDLYTSIFDDVGVTGVCYEFPIQLIEDLSEEAKQSLNGVAIKQGKNLKIDEQSYDPFEIDLSSVSASQATEIHATDAFKKECQLRLETISKNWDRNRLLIFSVAPRMMNEELAEEIRDSLKMLLKPRNDDNFNEIDEIVLEEALNKISSQNVSMFHRIEQYFSANKDLIKNSAVHKVFSNETSLKMINALVKEQKKHVFERFASLNAIYEGFARDANFIIESAEALKTGAGAHVRNILCSILQDSHKAEKSQTVADNHHADYIMGNRKKDTDLYDSLQQASENLYEILLLPDEHGFRKDWFDHAHTFPFPAVMNWKMPKLKELIGKEGYSVDTLPAFDKYNELRAPILKNGFQKFKEEMKQNKSDAFKEQIDALSKVHANDVPQFVFGSLNTLSTVYLYLLSETEHLPAFINKQVDAISEWSLGKNINYKVHIKDSIISMIKSSPSTGQGKTLNDNFKSYIPRTLEKAKQKEQEWVDHAQKGTDNGLLYKVLQIFALQAKQAALTAT